MHAIQPVVKVAKGNTTVNQAITIDNIAVDDGPLKDKKSFKFDSTVTCDMSLNLLTADWTFFLYQRPLVEDNIFKSGKTVLCHLTI